MNITELLTNLATGINALIRVAASKFNLTGSQAFLLLSIPFDGIPMSGLAHRMGLDNSTLTRNIQKLEKLGLVKQLPDNYDRRVKRVILSSEGISLIELFDEHLENQNITIIEQIDLDTQEHLLTVLEKLSWALECVREKS